MHACQSRYRPGCILHAAPGSDLCRPCQRAEAAGEPVPRIARPVWDKSGARLVRTDGESEILVKVRAMLKRDVVEEIPF